MKSFNSNLNLVIGTYGPTRPKCRYAFLLKKKRICMTLQLNIHCSTKAENCESRPFQNSAISFFSKTGCKVLVFFNIQIAWMSVSMLLTQKIEWITF